MKAYGIERIRTTSGRVLYDHALDKTAKPKVIQGQPLDYMNQMLRQVLLVGSGVGARVPGYDLAGKTGTTTDYRDAWFVGYTGGFTASVWVGKDNNTPMKAVTGGSFPARLWRTFMAGALPKLKVSTIPGGPPPPEPPSSDVIGALLGAPSSNPELPATAQPAPPDKAPPPAQGKPPTPEFF